MSADTPLESRPWWRPGLSEQEIAEWLSAEKVVAEAPEILPGSDVALRLKRPLADWAVTLEQVRAERRKAKRPAA